MISSVLLLKLSGCRMATVLIWGMMFSISILNVALVSLYDLVLGLGL